MQQTDSIHVTNITVGVDSVVPKKHHELTPAEILSWYPQSYSPSQQDSVIQLHMKHHEITHWSTRPDTLHLPGHTKGKSVIDATLPQYYKESYFSEKPYFHPEITGGRQGVAGDPVPYTIAGDNFMSSLLLAGFLLTILALMRSRQFIARQLKSFIYIQRGNTTEVTETSTEVRFQVLLIIESCVLLAILFFQYLQEKITDTFTIGQYQITGLFAGVFAGYFLVKQGLYSMVNWTFFDKKNIEQYNKALLFLTAMEGVFLLPLVFVSSFFYLSYNTALIYFIIVLSLFKILTFYKSYQIFFAPKGRLLQNFLYFCTLEIIPLSMLWGLLMIISGFLKINF